MTLFSFPFGLKNGVGVRDACGPAFRGKLERVKRGEVVSAGTGFLGRGNRMSFVSKVAAGKINIPTDVKLPEGSPVRVEPEIDEPLAKRLQGVIGSVDGLPPGFAENHDGYIRGIPKP